MFLTFGRRDRPFGTEVATDSELAGCLIQVNLDHRGHEWKGELTCVRSLI